MPTISRFFGIAITMYFDDHRPPRFRARDADGEAKVRIDTLEVIDSILSRRYLRLVLAGPSSIGTSSPRIGDGHAPVRCWTTRAPPMIGLTPDITNVAVVEHGVLRLNFADGLSGEVDVLSRMRGPVFERARTRDGFLEARVDRESGTVTWPGGADLAPDPLYERVRTGAWPGQDVAA